MTNRKFNNYPESFSKVGFCSIEEWEDLTFVPNPPQGEEFHYVCCNCNYVINSGFNPDIVKSDKVCPNCKIPPQNNFFCLYCNTILLDFNEENAEFCYCPMCKQPTKKNKINYHACKNSIGFETERLYCPICSMFIRHWVTDTQVYPVPKRLNVSNSIDQINNRIESLENKLIAVTRNYHELKNNDEKFDASINLMAENFTSLDNKIDKLIDKLTNSIPEIKPTIIKPKNYDFDKPTLIKANLNKKPDSAFNSSHLRGLISDIHVWFKGKEEPLTRYPLTPFSLKIAIPNEAIAYYRISVTEKGVEKHFAIPFITQITNDSEFKSIFNFYEARTTRLNGKMKIEIPAEIKWNDKIQGWTLVEKGKISIV